MTKTQIIEKAFRKGYEHAQKSFSLLTGHDIQLGSLNIDYDENNLRTPCIKDNLTVLKTEIFGASDGECYLILTPKERKYICENNKQKATYTGINDMAFLLELDNIISASVVTEISNVLNISIYGDVPNNMNISDWSLFKIHLQQKSNDEFFIVQMNFDLNKALNINPLMLFMFKKELLLY